MSGGHPDVARGFTLVEVLVAMAIFSLLAIASSAIASGVLSARESLDASDRSLAVLQTGRALMKADFAQIVLRPTRDAFGTARPAFAGGPISERQPLLAFVRGGWTNAGGLAERSSLQYVEYEVVDRQLIRRARVHVDPSPDTPSTTIVLAEDIDSVTISFLSKGQWRPQWRGDVGAGGAIPDAVAIEFRLGQVGPMRQVFAAAPS
ncbi:MAG: type II secretion system minor pseudopilin GspJ [Rhodospirillaceae bacterium]|nr:type II secretion system minor pseudopilin GspJ [Rhodospirillaceae bacterium]